MGLDLELDPEKFPSERYHPEKLLGKGAMGSVVLCLDKLLGKQVAIKTLQIIDGDDLISFQNEAKAINRLNHPGIVTILDFGATSGGAPFMVLEYFPGVSLSEILRSNGPLEPDLVTEIFAQAADALQHAHDRSVLHRDLKPSNLLIMETDDSLEVRLIDFGIAKVKELTRTGTQFQDRTLAGTPGYMAPDTILDKGYSERSEVYSLGCCLFEALTGAPPFEAETALETLSLHCNAPVPDLAKLYPEKISPELSELVTTCLQKNPEDRFQSMSILSERLSDVNTTCAGSSDSSTSGYSSSGNRRTRSIRGPIVWIIAISALSAIALVATMSYQMVFKSTGSSSNTDSSAQVKLMKFPMSSDSVVLEGIDVLNRPQIVIKETSNFRRMDCKFAKITSEDLKKYTGLVFDEIHFSGCRLTKSALVSLKNTPIGRLVLSKCQGITPSSLKDFCSGDNVKILRFQGHVITGEMLTPIGTTKRMTNLVLVSCPIEGSDMPKNQKASGIVGMEVNKCEGDLEELFGWMKDLPGLNNVFLKDLDLTPSQWSKFQQLEKIAVVIASFPNLSQTIAEQILELPALKVLTIIDSQVPDETIDYLVDTDLEGIELPRIDDKIAAKLANASFATINVGTSSAGFALNQLTDSGLRSLLENRNLKNLVITAKTHLTDKAIDLLIKAPNLEFLELGPCEISDAGIKRLTKSKSLKKLYFASDARISSARAAWFKQEHPGLETSIRTINANNPETILGEMDDGGN